MEWRRNDRATVLECLQRGEYDAIATTSQGALDELAHLTAELGVWETLEVDLWRNNDRDASTEAKSDKPKLDYTASRGAIGYDG